MYIHCEVGLWREAPFERDLQFGFRSCRMSLWIARSLRRTLSLIPSSSLPRFVSLRQVSTVSSILPDDIYDVVVVGGGIAGLAFTTGLCIPLVGKLIEVSSDTTNDLKIALIERNSLKASKLSGPPGNRCSSLTPGSVRFLQGTRSSYSYLL
jgi:hypothetical protein